ncbi:porin [Salipiger sp. PrR002]|uniref:porin n=1 Tax=Salipiger sp. PrR002 TaxID=2706489 RepID=UPI0013B5DD9F|nr:porin [Salipiger sp. PrR002]NDV98392.1 porin [Salipiger sp. PrR002]NDW55104.1 porin [Salipiger sp. PrR004]
MKKILFASTALVATAGVAAAEVTISGYAEMGIYNPGETTDQANDEAQFFTDIDLTFTMSGEADNGLVFGANIDLDEADNPFSDPWDQGGEALFVSYGGATLTMGDTDSAYDKIVPEMNLGGAGSLADDETIHAGFNDGAEFDGGVNGSDGQIARFDYAYDAFTFSVSAEQIADGSKPEDVGRADSGETLWSAGVGYSAELSGVDLSAGLGYLKLDEWAEVWGLGVTAGFAGGFEVGATYSDIDGEDGFVSDGEHWGLGFGYSMNAFSVGLNYGKYDFDDAGEQEGYGLAANYDLGGGLVAQFGYGYSEFTDGSDDDTWSLGLAMSF